MGERVYRLRDLKIPLCLIPSLDMEKMWHEFEKQNGSRDLIGIPVYYDERGITFPKDSGEGVIV